MSKAPNALPATPVETFHSAFAVDFIGPAWLSLSRYGYMKGPEFIIYNGLKMIKGWPEKMEPAQLQPTVIIGGIQRLRIRYGEEPDDWGADRQPCQDCRVRKGQLHVIGCYVERCPACGGQAISCDCDSGQERE